MEEHVVGAGCPPNSPQAPPQEAQVVVTNVTLVPPYSAPVPPIVAAPGCTAPPLDPVVFDLMTNEARRAERVNWSASMLSAFISGTPSPQT